MKSYSIHARIPKSEVSKISQWEKPQNGISKRLYMPATYKTALNDTGLTGQDMKRIVKAYKNATEGVKKLSVNPQAEQNFTKVCSTMVDNISKRNKSGREVEITAEEKDAALQEFMSHDVDRKTLRKVGLSKQDIKIVVRAYNEKVESEKNKSIIAQAQLKFLNVCSTMIDKISQRQIETGKVTEVTDDQKKTALQDFLTNSFNDLFQAVSSAKDRTQNFVWTGVGTAIGLLFAVTIGFIAKTTGQNTPELAWTTGILYPFVGALMGKGLSAGGLGASGIMHGNRLGVAYNMRAAVRDASDKPAETKP